MRILAYRHQEFDRGESVCDNVSHSHESNWCHICVFIYYYSNTSMARHLVLLLDRLSRITECKISGMN